MGGAPPKIIWSLWLQGWDQAPEIVRVCADSWTRLNPGWQVRRLTLSHVEGLFPAASPFARLTNLALPPEALSDVVRLELLARFGGVWADATTYCLTPLDAWLGPAMPEGFFAFDRPGPDRMLSTWFLAAQCASPAVLYWRTLAEAYWATRSRRHAYFWVHYLFSEAYQTDAGVRRIWDATPKWPAAAPLVFTPYQETLMAPLAEPARKIVEERRAPMLKLTHKLAPVSDDCGTLYRWLCDRERLCGREPMSGVGGGSIEAWDGKFR